MSTSSVPIQNRVPRSIADVTAGTILATVEIAAPPERVFRALASDEVVKWWGAPDLYQTTEWTGDVRVGGHWISRGKGADGVPFSVEGEFLEVSPPHKLVQTWKAAWDGGNVTTITYVLDTIPGGTRVTLRHEGFAGRHESCAGHAQGWERVLGWLSGHLVPAPSAVDKKYYVCRLLPPRPTFAADMSAAERAAMQAHAAYWKGILDRGVALVFGPVADPKGVYGLGIVRVDDEKELRSLEANDPAIKAEIGLRYEAVPMIQAVTAH